MYSDATSSSSSDYELAEITNKMEHTCIINEKNELCLHLSNMPYLKNPEGVYCCVQFITYRLQQLLMLFDRVDINIYIAEDVKMEMLKTAKIFFDIFKKELPNKLNKCIIYTKSKYKGIASVLLTFADRDTKSRMEILSI